MILFSFQNFTKSSSETSTIFAETSDKKLAENILGHLVYNFYYIDMSVSPKNRQLVFSIRNYIEGGESASTEGIKTSIYDN